MQRILPWEWAVLDGLLSVLPPAVSVLEVVDLALGHECEPRLPRPMTLGRLSRRRRLATAHHHPSPAVKIRTKAKKREKLMLERRSTAGGSVQLHTYAASVAAAGFASASSRATPSSMELDTDAAGVATASSGGSSGGSKSPWSPVAQHPSSANTADESAYASGEKGHSPAPAMAKIKTSLA
jgi:hypothetical protein